MLTNVLLFVLLLVTTIFMLVIISLLANLKSAIIDINARLDSITDKHNSLANVTSQLNGFTVTHVTEALKAFADLFTQVETINAALSIQPTEQRSIQ